MSNMFSGKKTTHSKPTPLMGNGKPARMPEMPNIPKFNMPKDHTCKVCPGASRKK